MEDGGKKKYPFKRKRSFFIGKSTKTLKKWRGSCKIDCGFIFLTKY
jgi:hypothetical protein